MRPLLAILIIKACDCPRPYLLILSDLIFDSRVDPGIPSLAAAPDLPNTYLPLSPKAASIITFS